MSPDDLRARLLRLQGMLDQLGEPIWWMKLDLKRFFGDGKVRALGGRIGHAYLWLLARMWENGGFISSKDRVVARLLDIDVDVYRRSYRAQIAAMLTRLPDAHLGEIFTQKTLVDLMVEAADLRLRNRDKTAAATRARKSAKSKQRPPVTNNVTKQRDDDRDDDRDDTVTETVTSTSNSNSRDKALPQVAESLIPTAPTVDAAALPPRENGHAGGSADVGSPGLGGRSPPQPSEKIEVTAALLATPLVKKARSGLMAALDDDED
jgi:hypothetical protein